MIMKTTSPQTSPTCKNTTDSPFYTVPSKIKPSKILMQSTSPVVIFKPGDHVMRWTHLCLYPIQVHGIVLSSTFDSMTLVDFGLSKTDAYIEGDKMAGEEGFGRTGIGRGQHIPGREYEDDSNGFDVDNGGGEEREDEQTATATTSEIENGNVSCSSATKNKVERLCILTLTEEKELKKWRKVKYRNDFNLKDENENSCDGNNKDEKEFDHDDDYDDEYDDRNRKNEGCKVENDDTQNASKQIEKIKRRWWKDGDTKLEKKNVGDKEKQTEEQRKNQNIEDVDDPQKKSTLKSLPWPFNNFNGKNNDDGKEKRFKPEEEKRDKDKKNDDRKNSKDKHNDDDDQIKYQNENYKQFRNKWCDNHGSKDDNKYGDNERHQEVVSNNDGSEDNNREIKNCDNNDSGDDERIQIESHIGTTIINMSNPKLMKVEEGGDGDRSMIHEMDAETMKEPIELSINTDELSSNSPTMKSATSKSNSNQDRKEKKTESKLIVVAATSDSTLIVLARLRYLLHNPDILPPHHILHANSECIAVWCKTGRWSTLQASFFLGSTACSNIKSSVALALYVGSQTVTTVVPSSGIMGWMGYTTTATVGLTAAQPWIVPVLTGYGIATIGIPVAMLLHSMKKWEHTTMILNDGFWGWADTDVYIEAIKCWRKN